MNSMDLCEKNFSNTLRKTYNNNVDRFKKPPTHWFLKPQAPIVDASFNCLDQNQTNSVLLEIDTDAPTWDSRVNKLKALKVQPQVLANAFQAPHDQNSDIKLDGKRRKYTCIDEPHQPGLVGGRRITVPRCDKVKLIEKTRCESNVTKSSSEISGPSRGLMGFLLDPILTLKVKLGKMRCFPWFEDEELPDPISDKKETGPVLSKLEKKLIRIEREVPPLDENLHLTVIDLLDHLEDVVIDNPYDTAALNCVINNEYNKMTDEEIGACLRVLLDAKYERGLSDAEKPLYQRIIDDLITLQFVQTREKNPKKEEALRVRMSKLSCKELQKMEILLMKETGRRDNLIEDVKKLQKENDFLMRKIVDERSQNIEMICKINERMKLFQMNSLPRETDVQVEYQKAQDKESAYHDACMRLEDVEKEWNMFRKDIQCTIDGLLSFWKPQEGFLWLLINAVYKYLQVADEGDPTVYRLADIGETQFIDNKGCVQRTLLRNDLMGRLNDFYDKIQVSRYWADKEHAADRMAFLYKNNPSTNCLKLKAPRRYNVGKLKVAQEMAAPPLPIDQSDSDSSEYEDNRPLCMK